jgi:hypothetical protein
LVEWEYLQAEHSSSVTGITKALEAAVVRVPAIGVKVIFYVLLHYSQRFNHVRI